MGRPIKKIFIGERGYGASPEGEGVASVTITDGGTTYADGTLVISAPDLVGGVQAEGTYTQTGGVIDVVTVTVAGSGYTSDPTVTPSDAGAGDAVLAAVLTATGSVVIQASAFVTGTKLVADITAQKGDTTYKVTTSEGTLDCTLVSKTPDTIGDMAIVATDSDSGTYWVTKLYNNTVRLEPDSGVQFTAGSKVAWAQDGVAVLDYSVNITG